MPTISDQLQAAGRRWQAAGFQQDLAARSHERGQIVRDINALIAHTNIRLRSLYDQPMIYAGNVPPKYSQIAAWAAGQADGGVAVAQQLSEFMKGRVCLESLPPQMQQLAVITHVSEYGRYGIDATESLKRWLKQIKSATSRAAAANLWRSYRTGYPISLNSQEDSATEWYGAAAAH